MLFLFLQQKRPSKDGLILLAEKEGFASLEPPAKQSTGLFFRLRANTQLKLLAPNSNPSNLSQNKNSIQTTMVQIEFSLAEKEGLGLAFCKAKDKNSN